jgi:hypothetical protein
VCACARSCACAQSRARATEYVRSRLSLWACVVHQCICWSVSFAPAMIVCAYAVHACVRSCACACACVWMCVCLSVRVCTCVRVCLSVRIACMWNESAPVACATQQERRAAMESSWILQVLHGVYGYYRYYTVQLGTTGTTRCILLLQVLRGAAGYFTPVSHCS